MARCLSKDPARRPDVDEVLRLGGRSGGGLRRPRAGQQALPGASGWITIGGDGGPQDKAITVLRIEPDGSTTALAVTSADGTPVPGPGSG